MALKWRWAGDCRFPHCLWEALHPMQIFRRAGFRLTVTPLVEELVESTSLHPSLAGGRQFREVLL
jgi:hypothetical protein